MRLIKLIVAVMKSAVDQCEQLTIFSRIVNNYYHQ